jgi:hypothetical protein
VRIVDFVAVASPELSEATFHEDSDPPLSTIDEELQGTELEFPTFSPIPKKRPAGASPWSTAQGPKFLAPELEPIESNNPALQPEPEPEPEIPKLKLGHKATSPQSELSLDATPRGRFEGEAPNVFDGEDLDLPPFLRKRKL